jgi:hypothetical protein
MPRAKKNLDAKLTPKTIARPASKTGAIARQKANKPTAPVISFPDANKRTKPIPSPASGVEAITNIASTEFQSDAITPTKSIPSYASEGEASDQQMKSESHSDNSDPRFTNPIIQKITIIWRRRQMIVRQQTSAALAAQAILRSEYCDHDKKKAEVLYDEIGKSYKKLKGKDSELKPYMAIKVFLDIDAVMQKYRDAYERDLEKMVVQLPIAAWQVKVRGFGEIGLAGIIGECGDLSKYRTVQGVYMRMGVGVIDGERQRKIAGSSEEKKALAIKHKYNPQRRAWLWNVAGSLLKGQSKGVLPYRVFYDMSKMKELEKLAGTKGEKQHAHDRAMRYMGKCLLRDLTVAWRELPSEESC